MPLPGFQELAVIAVILLILFGGARLPAIARSLASLPAEFMRGMRERGKDDKHL